MKTYKLGVIWQQYGYVEVEADNLTKAIKKVKKVSPPDNGKYIDGSINVWLSLQDSDNYGDERKVKKQTNKIKKNI